MHYTLRGKITSRDAAVVDKSLSVSGMAADAKVTGDAINTLQEKQKTMQETVENVVNPHVKNEENPHKVTAKQVGARPADWTPTAQDVGARPSTWMPTASDVGARPVDWMPTAQDVGARPVDWMPTASDVGAVTSEQVTEIVNDALGVIENGTY